MIKYLVCVLPNFTHKEVWPIEVLQCLSSCLCGFDSFLLFFRKKANILRKKREENMWGLIHLSKLETGLLWENEFWKYIYQREHCIFLLDDRWSFVWKLQDYKKGIILFFLLDFSQIFSCSFLLTEGYLMHYFSPDFGCNLVLHFLVYV